MEKIMIVDDDVELLEEIKEMLTAEDYEVEMVCNSTLAFEKARELQPDLIITDLKMALKSGFQLANELNNSPETKFIPIITLTGFFVEKEHIQVIKMFGVKHAIEKPFESADLLSKIKSALQEAKHTVA